MSEKKKFNIVVTRRLFYTTRHEVEAESLEEACNIAEDEAREDFGITCTSDNLEDVESEDARTFAGEEIPDDEQ